AIIHDFIRKLPDGYRIVFNLYAIEGKSHREIASMLGISESTSASQLHRAKALLASKIREYINRRSS
ncbi:MAG: sigma-70 region 4 domain-containing protein, partial [Duncaniella sp.]|nr:sigma-70 region 4 domain-containing protein [Duncaniella sp.]